MGKLDLLVVESIDLVPDEAEHIFAVPFDVSVNFLDRLLALNTLLVALVDECGELLEFGALQESDVHHVDQGPAVLELLLRIIEIHVQLLQWPSEDFG